MDFKDHFSKDSDAYTQFRPSYPRALIDHLITLLNEKNLAWDCATGNGQSAVMLADYFSSVIATDASANQIRNATSKPNIDYKVEPAERTSITSHSVDLVTVAQALHWFDFDAFSKEAIRVLKPQGILAAWTYDLLTINPALDVIINHLNSQTLQHYWPPERKHVENSYGHIHFPSALDPLETITITMKASWSLHDLTGYLHTWSAVKQYHQSTGINPLDPLQHELKLAWGEPIRQIEIKWPLTVRIWRYLA